MIKSVKQVKYADSFLTESAIYTGGDRKKEVPIIFAFYLIETDKRIILVDAGCDTMGGFVMNNYLLPDEAVAHYGINPDNVTDVIITHADHDHIDGVHHFKNATIYIQKDEYDRGKSYIPEKFKVKIFKESITVDGVLNVIRIGGHQKGSCVVEFKYNGSNCVIVGDECYSSYNIKHKIPTASTHNLENSKKFIEKYTNGEYKIFLMHEEV